MTVVLSSPLPLALPCDIAMDYLARGWLPIPVPFRGKGPTKSGWQKLRLDTAGKVLVNFNGKPQNIGVLLGEPSSGLVDIDLDHPVAVELADQFLPATGAVFGRAGNPRSHRLYRVVPAPKTAKWANADLAGKGAHKGGGICELRSTGHQTVFPGSTHESGESIEWQCEGEPEPAEVSAKELQAACAALYRAVCERLGVNPANRSKGGGKRREKKTPKSIEEKRRAYAERALRDELDKVARAAEGHRNDTLNAAALVLGQLVGAGVLDRGQVASQLLAAAGQSGLGEDEAARTIASGMAAGEQQPRDLSDIGRPLAETAAARNAPLGAADLLQPERRNDLANAARFAALHGEDVKFVASWHKAVVWDGKRWCVDSEHRVETLARDVPALLWRQLKALEEACATPDQSEQLAPVRRFVEGASSARGLSSLLQLARSEPGASVSPRALDADPWALNVANGVLDLRTGKLRPHAKADLFTKLCPTPYEPRAACPIFTKFLAKIFADNTELIAFVQRAFGLSLAGVVREHVLFVLWGQGQNGKSTLTNAVRNTLGKEYSLQAPSNFLTVDRFEQHPTGVADLAGMRLVVGNETDDGRRFDEALIKTLTSNEEVRARRMREDFWSFTPSHTLFLCTNHRPQVSGTDQGIWRRIKLVPFAVSIPKAEQDHELEQKLLAEAPGILAWLVQGCLQWQRGGLNPPKEVVFATAEYRTEQDVLGDFLEECIDRKPAEAEDGAGHWRCPASYLYAAYKSWAERTGHKPYSQTRFGGAMRDRGIQKGVSNGTYYDGLRLKGQRETKSRDSQREF